MYSHVSDTIVFGYLVPTIIVLCGVYTFDDIFLTEVILSFVPIFNIFLVGIIVYDCIEILIDFVKSLRIK